MIINNPISIQGQVTRAQDMSAIKQNDDNRAFITQMNMQRIGEDEVEVRARQVQEKADTENEPGRHDAREKGNNQYYGDGGKRRKREDGVIRRRGPDDTMIVGFDIKV